jgi:hypothetical protein
MHTVRKKTVAVLSIMASRWLVAPSHLFVDTASLTHLTRCVTIVLHAPSFSLIPINSHFVLKCKML